ncbi:hypothetical protein FRC12_010199 [Ceratobasidium sp. 428]|nr:hypothetical protein FRC12_010199 [Ceratobasidium sp. 428]
MKQYRLAIDRIVTRVPGTAANALFYSQQHVSTCGFGVATASMRSYSFDSRAHGVSHCRHFVPSSDNRLTEPRCEGRTSITITLEFSVVCKIYHGKYSSPNDTFFHLLTTLPFTMTVSPKRTHARDSTLTRKQRLSSAAQSASSPRHVDLTYYHKLKLVDYWAANRRLTRAGIALHFRTQFPHITSAIISEYLAQEAALRQRISTCPSHPGHLCLTPVTLLPHPHTNLLIPCPHIRNDNQGAVESSTGSPTSLEQPTGSPRVSDHREAASASVTDVEHDTQHRIVNSDRPIVTEISDSE